MAYSIDDGNGDLLAAGLQGYDRARREAQHFADSRGEAVYLYEDRPDSESEEVVPRLVAELAVHTDGAQHR